MKLTRATRNLGLITTGWYLFLFIIKCLQFHQCQYTSDLITHLQISRDWLLGKPLFYENCYGRHDLIHNYFFDPLMGILTYSLNAYGIFLILFIFMVAAAWSAFITLQKFSATVYTQCIFFIFISCPAVFYIIHNEHYGFHAEMLLFPFYILFSSCILRQSPWRYFWAVIAFMVKEESAAIVLCIWLAGNFFLWDSGQIQRNEFLKRCVMAIVVCVTVFLAGFSWLKHLNASTESRSGHVVDALQNYPLHDILDSFTYLVLLRIQLTAFIILMLFIYSGWKFTLVGIILSIPVLLLNFLSGIFYLENDMIMIRNYFSLLWCPRFSIYWGYWMSILAMALLYKRQGFQLDRKIRTWLIILFGIALFIYQHLFFQFSYVTRLSLFNNITQVFKPSLEFTEHPEFYTAVKIADHLPSNYPVAPMYQVFGAFCKQDIVWLNSLGTAYRKPRMIMASFNNNEVPPPRKIMDDPYYLKIDSLYIYAEAPDTIYVNEAGYKQKWTKIEE
jgi:hypothetical protein